MCSVRSITTCIWLAALGGTVADEMHGSGASAAWMQAQNIRPSPSRWQISVRQDPMTDARVYTAISSLFDSGFEMQVEVICQNDHELSYGFGMYRSRKGISVRNQRIQIRANSATPRWTDEFAPIIQGLGVRWQYSNRPSLVGPLSLALKDASRLTIRAEFDSGVGTFVIDQTDTRLRSVLNRCRPVDVRPAS